MVYILANGHINICITLFNSLLWNLPKMWAQIMMTMICWCQWFVDAIDLLVPMICFWHWFVDANDLLMPMISWCQWFFDANYFLMPLICWCHWFLYAIDDACAAAGVWEMRQQQLQRVAAPASRWRWAHSSHPGQDQFINAHNKPTTPPSVLPDVKIRTCICGTVFRDEIAITVESDSDLLKLLRGLFCGRITSRSSGGLLHWAAVKKHSPSQKLLNWNTETHWKTETLAKHKKQVASVAQ